MFADQFLAINYVYIYHRYRSFSLASLILSFRYVLVLVLPKARRILKANLVVYCDNFHQHFPAERGLRQSSPLLSLLGSQLHHRQLG